MKKPFSTIKSYLTFKGFFATLFIAGVIFTLYHERPAQAMFGDDPAEGAFFGGVTGATIGGIAGGGKGAAIGGIAGAGLGAMSAVSADNRSHRDRKLDRLYKRRHHLEQQIRNARSAKRKDDYQRQLNKVEADISSYEGRSRYHR